MQQVGISPCTYILEVGEQTGETRYQGSSTNPALLTKQACPRGGSLSDPKPGSADHHLLRTHAQENSAACSHSTMTWWSSRGFLPPPSPGSPVWSPSSPCRRDLTMRLEGSPATCLLVLAWPLLRVRTHSQFLLCRLSLTQWRFLGDKAEYIVPQCHLLPERAAANRAPQRQSPACSRNGPVHQHGLRAKCTESDHAEAALRSSAQAVTAPRPYSKGQLGHTAHTEPYSGNFSQQPEGRDFSLSSAFVRAHLGCHSHFWPCW